MDAVALVPGLADACMTAWLRGVLSAGVVLTDMLALFHTPTEAFRQYARMTQQGVVLWLWRSDLDDVELVLGLVHAYMTTWLLRGARVAFMTDTLALFHTPTEAFRQHARVTQQGVVLGL